MKIAFFEVQDEEKEVFRKVFREHELFFSRERLNLENVEKVKDYEAVSIFIYSNINSSLLDKMSKLRYLVTRSMGFDHIDLVACKSRNIAVSNTPHYGDNSVAEHVFGIILSISRNIHKAYVRTLKDDHSIEGLEGFDLKGKTIGVVGVGRIGRKVIQIAKGFEMKVLACDHHKDRKFAKEHGFRYASFNEVIKNSDIVTLHVPYCKENYHLINDKTLKRFKKNSILINTSRGAVVDTRALMNALNKKHLLAAGLDVIEGEELIKEEKELLHHKKLNVEKMKKIALDHKILYDERVVFTPHIAFYSKEAMERIISSTIENIHAFIKNKRINIIGD